MTIRRILLLAHSIQSHFTQALVIATICVVVHGAMTKACWAAEDQVSAFKADQDLAKALEKSDRAAVGALLDEKFEWTDSSGKTWSRAQLLQNLSAFIIQGEGDWAHSYGHVAVVLNIHHNPRFAHVWVKRPAGWRAFVFLDTPIPGPATSAPTHYGPDAVCGNPCKTLPYTPTTEIDRQILSIWQSGKIAEWHPDPDNWATQVGDEFLIINDLPRLQNGIASKAERVAQLVKAKEQGVMGAPGDPIESMRMSDFGGDSCVIVSHHVPRNGGKPYYNVRVWVFRDGRWQIVVSQQTTISSAPPVDVKSTMPM